MKTKHYLILFFAMWLSMGIDLFAQSVIISAEVRPRYEYRHGYKTLFPDGKEAANFISQRTRLNGFFANEYSCQNCTSPCKKKPLST
jgi:hypothetical protein